MAGPVIGDAEDWYQWSHDGSWSAAIQYIYWGVPHPISDRSILSTNTPKNGFGDERECGISACQGSQGHAGDPINTLTGNFDHSLVDLSIPTLAGPLSLQRSYASQALEASRYTPELAPGWAHNQDIRLVFEPGSVWFKAHTLNQYQFIDQGNHVYIPTAGVLASLVYDSGLDTYTLTTVGQAVYTFDPTGRIHTWRNELGYGFDYSYANNHLDRVTEPVSGRYLQFAYQADHLALVTDHAGRQVSFGYDGNGDLGSITDVFGKTWTYTYSDHRLTSLQDPSTLHQTILSVAYDTQGRAYEQFNGAGDRIVKIEYRGDGTRTLLDAFDRAWQEYYDGNHTLTGQIDPAGYAIQKSFDSNFRLTHVKGPGGETLEYSWSSDGANLLSIRDAAGYETTFEYDPQNHLIRVWDPNQRETSYGYNGALLTSSTRHTSVGDLTASYTYTTGADAPQPINLLKTMTNPKEHTTTFIYDSLGQLVLLRDAQQNETHFAYDDHGQVREVIDAHGQTTQFGYDLAGRLVEICENYDPARPPNDLGVYNRITGFTYDDFGRLTHLEDTLGRSTSYTYDPAGRLVQITDDQDQATTYTYFPDGQLETVTDRLGQTVSLEYDPAGRAWRVRDPLGQVIRTVVYYPDGTLASLTQPTQAGDYRVSYSYDALNRATEVSDNAGHLTAISYDAYGHPLSVTDGMGQGTQYEYNELGLLSAVVQNYMATPPPEADPNGTNVRSEYEYDELGNLNLVRDANGQETTYEYDSLNRLWRITDPLDHVTEFGYDALGNRTSLLDANGQTSSFEYDPANRLVAIDYPAGASPDVAMGYDALGRLIGMDDSLGHTAWVYDNLNRVTSITDPFGKITGYGYDAEGKRTSITYPNPINKTITYQYNILDQLESVLDGANPLVDYRYDIAGRLSSETRSNGITSTYSYDLAGQLVGLSHQTDTATLADYHYQYDAAGNRTQALETVAGPNLASPPVIEIDYTYDALNRLTGADYSSGESYVYTYDRVGNRTLQSLNGVDTLYQYDTANRLTSVGGVAYTWDDNGNLLSDGTNTYAYDAVNRLAGLTQGQDSYSFQYDGLGHRYQQTVNGLTITYLLDQAGGLTQVLADNAATYLYGADRIALDSPAGRAYFLPDALGSVRQTADLSAALTHAQAFDPFGSPIQQSGPAGAFGYAGEQTDPTGLQYLRARYYAPAQGRFLTRDPFPGLLANPSTLNAYPYVTNNPVRDTDPSGLIAPWLLAGLVGGALGAGIDLGVQLLALQPDSLDQALRCLDWGRVGLSLAAGAVAGLSGFAVFGGMTALLGSGGWAHLAAGALSGVVAGQYARLTEGPYQAIRIRLGQPSFVRKTW